MQSPGVRGSRVEFRQVGIANRRIQEGWLEETDASSSDEQFNFIDVRLSWLLPQAVALPRVSSFQKAGFHAHSPRGPAHKPAPTFRRVTRNEARNTHLRSQIQAGLTHLIQISQTGWILTRSL